MPPRQEPPRAAGKARLPGAQCATDDALLLCGMEAGPRRARLSHRDRRPLLLGAVEADPRDRRSAHHQRDGRGLPQGSAGRQPCGLRHSQPAHHNHRAHAERASPLRGMDAGQADARGGQGRPGNGRAVRSDHEGKASSRAGLPLVPRHCRAHQKLWPNPPRSRIAAWQRHRRDQLRLDRLDPQARARQSSRNRTVAGPPADPARQHPWLWLLPLTSAATQAVKRKEQKMLTHPTEQRLIALGLAGMAKALEEQRRLPDVAALAFEERLALMVDREAIERQNKRLVSRLKFAGLRHNAVVEDVDLKAPRGLDKALFAKLAAGDWIDRHQNLIVIGPTGVGKSWIACALAHTACRNDRSVLYQRVPRLFDALALARGDGRHARLLKTIARVDLLILDDWGLSTLTPEQARDLLEIIDDRPGRGSTIVTSQLPVDHWHEVIGNPTIADAILDRLVHNAHRLTLKGDSMRKIAAKRSGLDASSAL